MNTPAHYIRDAIECILPTCNSLFVYCICDTLQSCLRVIMTLCIFIIMLYHECRLLANDVRPLSIKMSESNS